MILNHINLRVHDVASAKDFFTKYLGMKTVFERGKNFLAIMTDDVGTILNLSHFDKKSETPVEYHKDFHIGFFQKTRAEVDAIHATMIADGLSADPPKQEIGRYGFYIQTPGGILTEIASFEGEDWAS